MTADSVAITDTSLDRDEIKVGLSRLAKELGFAKCGVAVAREAPHAAAFQQWLAEGFNATMSWLAREFERRCDPRLVMSKTRSVIVLATNYFQGSTQATVGWRVARYAWGRDYHEILKERLLRLSNYLAQFGGHQVWYTDTGPVLERDHGSLAGVGWQGKSTMLLDRELGTWFFLSVILTSLELRPDIPSVERCGRCTRCIDVCPTGAIATPWRLDARRCLAFLTIENRGPIPLEFREALGDRIFGCDDCLEVCPWNRFAKLSQEAAFAMSTELASLTLEDFLDLDREAFNRLFKESPVKRAKFEGFLRNACVVAGNSGKLSLLTRLERLASSESALVAEHAQWAIKRLTRHAFSRRRLQIAAGK